MYANFIQVAAAASQCKQIVFPCFLVSPKNNTFVFPTYIDQLIRLT